MEAVRHIPLEDREAFKYALGATLVKNHAHWRSFETVFEVYFSLRGPEFKVDTGGRRLHLPLAPIRRDPARPRYNVVWLAAESWRWDMLDPAIMPATGTPEPGGLSWYEGLSLLRKVIEQRNVVAWDIVELSPMGGNVAPNFLCAKLVYKILSYRFRQEVKRK